MLSKKEMLERIAVLLVTSVEANCKIYRELICDMVEGIHSEKFLKQIYSILARHIQRTGV